MMMEKMTVSNAPQREDDEGRKKRASEQVPYV